MAPSRPFHGKATERSETLVYVAYPGIGDLMWHLPTIRAIAATTAQGQVVVAARPPSRAAEILAAEPSVSAVLYAPHRLEAVKGLLETLDFWRLCRDLRPRAVWILEKTSRPALGAFLAGVPERRGWGEGRREQERWLNVGPFLPRAMAFAHPLEKLAAFERLHGLAVASREPDLRLDPGVVAAVAARFAAAPKPWLVLGIGSREATRIWPIERYAAVSRALEGRFGTVFWLGGPADAERARMAIAGFRAAPLNLPAFDLTLDAAAALISLAAAFLGNDSGPLNIAAAVGRPAVGLTGKSPLPLYSRWLTLITAKSGRIGDIAVDEALAGLSRGLAETA